MNVKTYQPGEVIIAEGMQGDETFLIHSGAVLICKETGRKGRILLAKLEPGEVFGEMYLMDNAGFRSATAIAETQVTVEVISREEILRQLEETPPIVKSMIKTLSRRLNDTTQECSLLKARLEPFYKKWFRRFL